MIGETERFEVESETWGEDEASGGVGYIAEYTICYAVVFICCLIQT